jgi:hypothetical protein
MDAKLNQFGQVLKFHSDPSKRWTNYDVKLGRSLFTGSQKLQEPQEIELSDPPDETA